MDAIPVLTGHGDLGPALLRLMQEIEALRQTGEADVRENSATEQPCTCQERFRPDNATTLASRSVLAPNPSAPHPETAAPPVYGALAAVLASCGRVDALRLVEGFRPSRPRRSCPARGPRSRAHA